MGDSSDDEVEHLQYKVIVMGDGAVGKTSLINRYCEDGFASNYKQTIGVDWFNKKLVLPGNVHVTLQIWDIGGQQVGGKMLGKYIYGSHAVIFAYDTTNPETFKNVDDWYDFVVQEFRTGKRPLMTLVGNKIDLNHLRAVKPEKHSLYAVEHGMTQFQVSAKTGERVGAMFTKVAADLAGVQLTKADYDASETVKTAQIVNHQAAPIPTNIQGPPPKVEKKEDDGCTIQ